MPSVAPISKYLDIVPPSVKQKYEHYNKIDKDLTELLNEYLDARRTAYDKFYTSESGKEYLKVRDDKSSTHEQVSKKLYEAFDSFKDETFIDIPRINSNIDDMYRQIAKNNYHFTRVRVGIRTLFDLPEQKGTPTDDETKMCDICAVNIKDHALSCGHVFCIECINKMKCECPNCKKYFTKSKVIKLYI